MKAILAKKQEEEAEARRSHAPVRTTPARRRRPRQHPSIPLRWPRQLSRSQRGPSRARLFHRPGLTPILASNA